jgi:hypothetical protein
MARDITDAAIFRKLHADLSESVNGYWREFNQSQTFWYLSFHAYAEIALHRLSRIYVGHDGALSLGSWLQSIKNNPQLFPAQPDASRLDEDIHSAASDPVVKKLVALRGSFVAHINWRNVAENLRLGDRFALSLEDIDLLISRAVEILNRYSVLFKQTSWSTVISGGDDFRILLRAVRCDLQRMDAEVADQIQRAKRAESAGPDEDR